MQKNEEYRGIVGSLGSEGEGVINVDGGVAFVPNCLIGEDVSFKALKVKDNVAYGKLTAIYVPSNDRREPVCPVYEKCGGCQLQHASYEAQLAFKRETVKNCLRKLGGLDVEVNETVPSVSEFRYRNKLALPVGKDANGKNVVGFYAQRSHRIVPIEDCALQKEWAQELVKCLYKFMEVSGFDGYDEERKKGVIRHIVGRELSGNYIFTLVTTRKINTAVLEKLLSEKFENYTLSLNVNKGTGNAIFGAEWHICHGEGFFESEDMGVKFKAGANTFLQVNDGVREKLYKNVVENVSKEGYVALDLYSGGGMLTAMLAKKCGEAYGIEIIKEAVVCADELKELNGLQGKMRNICGAVEDHIDEVFAMTEGKKRVIVCDPPRKGMERSVVQKVKESGADNVVLVSCNPATLARDLGILLGTLVEENGALKRCDSPVSPYTLISITPFDMFPQTKHVETLVCLSKKSGKTYQH